jgi:hypothetical protein
MGTGGDFSAIQVLDLTTMTQVAEWRSNKVSTPDQVDLLRKILLFIHQTLYNDPNQDSEPEIYWTVENNAVGEAALVAIDAVGEEHFPGYFVSEPRKSGGGRGRKGINTNVRTKNAVCSKMKSLAEGRKIIFKSRALITELKNFVRGGGSYKAKPGMHDDLVLSMLHVIRILQIIGSWDDQFAEVLKHTDFGDEDDYDMDPLPVVI